MIAPTIAVWGARIMGLTGDYRSDGCPCCGNSKTPIALIVRAIEPNRYGDQVVRERVRIGGEASVCTNRRCPRFTDLDDVPSWAA